MSSLPTGALLFDTGIYIRSTRKSAYPWLSKDPQIFRRTILTVVVAAELYAGTRDHREKRALDELCHAHESLGHFSTPSEAEWIETGSLLRCARGVFGHMGSDRHFRDLLIGLEAVGAGATLVTENIRDFARWKSLLASADKRLKLFDPSQGHLA